MVVEQRLVRYKTKPEATGENVRLIEAVFEELHARSPDGVRYLVLKAADGTFVHFAGVEAATGRHPLQALAAFRSFQGGIKERCLDPPAVDEVTVVGNYRMLGE